MSRDIYTEAELYFLESGRQYEYGRSDKHLKNQGGNLRTDSSRTEQDNDRDGRRGVDCSAFVWRGLREAGYGVPDQPFTTHQLFEGRNATPYARQHFDVVSGADARKPNGSLQPGDIIMFRDRNSPGQHVGIFKGYDAQGNIQFIGSQVSTGPAEVTIRPHTYWDGKEFEIVGALRAKPEFRVREPAHGQGDAPQTATPTARSPQTGATAINPSTERNGILREGAHGTAVHDLQETLNRLGYRDERGKPIDPDSDFGPHTKAAVERFQRSHGLEPDGVAGPQTMDALRKASPRLDGGEHPDRTLYTHARDAVYRLDAQHQRKPDEYSDRMAAAITVAARSEGMNRVDHATLNDDATKVYAVEGDLNSPFKRVAEVSTQQAANTSIEESSRQWQLLKEQQAQSVPQQPAQSQNVPTPASPAPSQSA